MKNILITGATGHLGGEALNQLIEKTDPQYVSVIARDPLKLNFFKDKGINVFQADYDKPSTLEKAFQGIDTLYFVSASDIGKRSKQHENIVAAAKKAGIKHVVYTSFQRKNGTEKSPIAPIAQTHLETERWLKESGVSYTILKHALYLNVVPMFIGDQVIENGSVYFPAGEGKAAYASRSEMAEAAVNILTSGNHENKVYEISNTESYSYHDVAKILSEISGKEITYISPNLDEYKKTMKGFGLPDEIIGMAAMFGEGIKQGEFDFPDNTLEKLIGRKPESLSDFFKKVYS